MERAALARSRRRAESLQRAERFIVLLRRIGRLGRKGPARVEYLETDFGRVRSLWYDEGWDGTRLFVDLHGGGFVMGGPELDEAMNLRIAAAAGCAVVSLEYAKAPNHPFPRALDQCYAAIKAIAAGRGGSAAPRIAVGGHSAGGNLAAAICLRAKVRGDLPIACQILDYPPLDLHTPPADKPQPAGAIPPKTAAMFNDCYLAGADGLDILASPAFALAEDVAGLPPALVVLAGRDSLFDEGRRYFELLQSAGVPAECAVYPEATHGFTLGASADAADAVGKMADFLRRYLR
jgi:acetyl esterase